MCGVNFPEGYYGVKEAAKMAGFSESQLRILDNSGQVVPERLPFGKREYRAYKSEEIEKLKFLKHDKRGRKILSLQCRLAKLLKDEN